MIHACTTHLAMIVTRHSGPPCSVTACHGGRTPCVGVRQGRPGPPGRGGQNVAGKSQRAASHVQMCVRERDSSPAETVRRVPRSCPIFEHWALPGIRQLVAGTPLTTTTRSRTHEITNPFDAPRPTILNSL